MLKRNVKKKTRLAFINNAWPAVFQILARLGVHAFTKRRA